jgi:hypothetical protein
MPSLTSVSKIPECIHLSSPWSASFILSFAFQQSSRKGVSVDRVFELMTADIGDIRQQVETAVATMKGQQDQGQQWASGQFVADLAKEMETLQRNHRLLLDVFSAAVVAVGATPAHGVSDRKPRAQLAVITEPGGHLGEFMTFLLSDEDLFLLKEPCKSSGVAGKPTYDANCAELVQRWLTCSPEASVSMVSILLCSLCRFLRSCPFI